MASAFGHAAAAIAIGAGFAKQIRTWKFFLLGIVCSILPDADVIGFAFGVPYESFWGHRGFTHSLVFAALLGIIVTAIFYRKRFTSLQGLALMLFFALCTASHDVLDAMTTGGHGIAFLSPFDNTRYFFPWRVIKVSPIGVENFFSEWGKSVLLSEAIWIGIPCTVWLATVWIVRKIRS